MASVLFKRKVDFDIVDLPIAVMLSAILLNVLSVSDAADIALALDVVVQPLADFIELRHRELAGARKIRLGHTEFIQNQYGGFQ